MIFLFSSQSVAKSDSQSSLLASNVNIEFNNTELKLDDGDSCNPALLCKNNIESIVITLNSAVLASSYIPVVNSYSIYVRAPPLIF
ncbi:hypothetical protein L0668_05595 [Paraglaciecola aquimarina]|uniref:Uncharacterized protein n=1 Tax=Paraglaciecola algarum TaxID=3050085 RepID=A0ABS9D6B0_9ALTE|nr:hypothetical protein [Paraglaciecola sp. G1-23]MCF2947573.1 hypothetical protein [Paraglaciecola sp. G1-23]